MDRKNRKNAEKMAIRVERSISDEGDGQENRIAASSAKCKENKAGWSFYQGQVSGCITQANAERLVFSQSSPASQSETRLRLIAAAVAKC